MFRVQTHECLRGEFVTETVEVNDMFFIVLLCDSIWQSSSEKDLETGFTSGTLKFLLKLEKDLNARKK